MLENPGGGQTGDRTWVPGRWHADDWRCHRVPLIVATQVLWGLGWAFSGGADVAWLTDELDRSDRIAQVLTARARWDLAGGATGMVAFGVLGWAAGLAPAIVVSGAAMALLGLFVVTQFTEDNFTPARESRVTAATTPE